MSEVSTATRPKTYINSMPNQLNVSDLRDGCEIIQLKDLHINLAPHKHLGSNIPYLESLSIESIRFISDKLNIGIDESVLLISKHSSLSSETRTHLKESQIKAVVDLDLTNHTRFINRHFEFINSILPKGGIYLGCVETNNQRNVRLYQKVNKFIARMIIFIEFLLHRVVPKISFFQGLYYSITKGKYRFLTKSETLGRLASCGFKIMDLDEIDNVSYFVVSKQREPYFDLSPSYGPIIKLRRVGKNGKIFNVYKFRTMHPYSEYLQDFVVRCNGYNEVGKPANDFRVAEWGKVFRKYWFDEMPQIINVLKGEMKIMGVRPLSVVRFSEFPKEMQDLRIREKTGCIPPYVALNMPSHVDNIEAEKIYLLEKSENPIFTDLKYISMAVYNILTWKIRSS
ncbi:MAG: sugar transferase [Bacteroidetes bacterium]|nr:MAG: sugar transferase [Bacteroidota bacterium]